MTASGAIESNQGSVAPLSLPPGKEWGVCDVHRLLFSDTEPRVVGYCPLCRARLCEDCRTRYDLRFIAAVKRWFGE